MRTQARFRTALFAVPAADADQADNGRALAHWLMANLPRELRVDAIAEDWGQRLVFVDPELAPLSIACGHVDADQWSCACDAPTDGSRDTDLARVVGALDALFDRTPEITDVEWFANDASLQEFDHAPRAFAASTTTSTVAPTPPPRTMRGMGRWHRAANAAGLAALAVMIAREPTSALVLGVAALPLWLALFAARRGAPTALRGGAIFANVACGLGCAVLLAFTAVHAVTQGMDPSRAALSAALFLPILALNLLNLRALVGPAQV